MSTGFVAVLVVVLSLLLVPPAMSTTLQPQPQTGLPTLRVATHGPFRLTSAYLSESKPWVASSPAGPIAANRRFSGETQIADNITAAPGILALSQVNAFVTCPPNYGQPWIQSVRFTQQLPASLTVPEMQQPRVFVQFGTGIRTWWSLMYIPPGTRFTLEVTVRCVAATPFQRPLELHIDRWIWEVVVTFASLRAGIDLLHSNSLAMSGIPCIAAEETYQRLLKGVAQIEALLTNRRAAQEKLYNLQGIIILSTATADLFDPGTIFNAFPPSDCAQMGPLGPTAILDTLDNPCSVKLLLDLEGLAKAYRIAAKV